jgi:hypothetical protein
VAANPAGVRLVELHGVYYVEVAKRAATYIRDGGSDPAVMATMIESGGWETVASAARARRAQI